MKITAIVLVSLLVAIASVAASPVESGVAALQLFKRQPQSDSGDGSVPFSSDGGDSEMPADYGQSPGSGRYGSPPDGATYWNDRRPGGDLGTLANAAAEGAGFGGLPTVDSVITGAGQRWGSRLADRNRPSSTYGDKGYGLSASGVVSGSSDGNEFLQPPPKKLETQRSMQQPPPNHGFSSPDTGDFNQNYPFGPAHNNNGIPPPGQRVSKSNFSPHSGYRRGEITRLTSPNPQNQIIQQPQSGNYHHPPQQPSSFRPSRSRSRAPRAVFPLRNQPKLSAFAGAGAPKTSRSRFGRH